MARDEAFPAMVRGAITAQRRLAQCLAWFSILAALVAWGALAVPALSPWRLRALDTFALMAVWLLGAVTAITSGHAARRTLPWTVPDRLVFAVLGMALGYLSIGLVMLALTAIAILVAAGRAN